VCCLLFSRPARHSSSLLQLCGSNGQQLMLYRLDNRTLPRLAKAGLVLVSVALLGSTVYLTLSSLGRFIGDY
jgi:hypothetical protein